MPLPLYPRERDPVTHWTGGWAGHRTGLEAVVKRKIPRPFRDSNPQSHSPWLSAIPLSYPRVLIKNSCSSNSENIIKQIRMTWIGHIERIGEIQNSYRIFVEKFGRAGLNSRAV
jgi:hypothetical protein